MENTVPGEFVASSPPRKLTVDVFAGPDAECDGEQTYNHTELLIAPPTNHLESPPQQHDLRLNNARVDGWLAELEVSTAWSVGSYMLCAYIEGEKGEEGNLSTISTCFTSTKVQILTQKLDAQDLFLGRFTGRMVVRGKAGSSPDPISYARGLEFANQLDRTGEDSSDTASSLKDVLGVDPTLIASAGAHYLATMPYSIEGLLIARRFVQTHYRLQPLWDLRHHYLADCLSMYTKHESERGVHIAHCRAFDNSPEAWLAEIEMRLKVLRAEKTSERMRLELDAADAAASQKRPPREIPEEMHALFTMNGSAKVYPHYRDDSHAGVYPLFTSTDMVALERATRLRLASLTYIHLDKLLYELMDQGHVCGSRAPGGGRSGQGGAAAGGGVESAGVGGGAGDGGGGGGAGGEGEGGGVEIAEAGVGGREGEGEGGGGGGGGAASFSCREFFVNSSVAVLGSTQPWYKALALSMLTNADDSDCFDIILSISSFEHDGLGRYGDPLDPDGDLRAMQESSKMLRLGGVLILAVPVAADGIAWNAHRIYGRRRLRRLFHGWKVLHVLGLNQTDLDLETKDPAQPVFVLKRRDFGDRDYSDMRFLDV